MSVVFLAVAVLFVVLGIIFSFGKGAFLIAGYNISSEEKKAQYDEKALCKFMGKAMFALAFCAILWALSSWISQPVLLIIGMVLFVGTLIFMLVYMNTGNRFKKTDGEPAE